MKEGLTLYQRMDKFNYRLLSELQCSINEEEEPVTAIKVGSGIWNDLRATGRLRRGRYAGIKVIYNKHMAPFGYNCNNWKYWEF